MHSTTMFKISLAILVAFFMTVYPPGVSAQQFGAGKTKGDFIQQFDKDKDGRVSREEFTGPEKLFDIKDKNQDGFIDQSEASQRPSHGMKKSGDFIKDFDKNNDGRVSREEFTGPEKLFSIKDKNQDGFIDQSEASQRPPHGMKKDGDMMKQVDEDKEKVEMKTTEAPEDVQKADDEGEKKGFFEKWFGGGD